LLGRLRCACAVSAGDSGMNAVLLARGFFEPQDSYSQDAACQTEDRNSPVRLNSAEAVTLYPNPATESFVLYVGKTFEKGNLNLLNSQGVLLRSLNLSGNTTIVPVSDLSDGVYYINIHLDSSVTIRKTFVKIK
jgi:Secretion system C-terminal sorting domain